MPPEASSNPLVQIAISKINADDPPAYDQIVSRHEFRWDLERDAIREFLSGKYWRALTMRGKTDPCWPKFTILSPSLPNLRGFPSR